MAEKRKRAGKTVTKSRAPQKPKTSKAKTPRTATGKKASPQVLADAAQDSRDGLRDRTEYGHRAAGRTPPSEKDAKRTIGASRVVDDSIRDYTGPITEDEKLLQSGSDQHDFTRSDPWRVMRITGEFIEGFDNLAHVKRGVSIFGSARTHP